MVGKEKFIRLTKKVIEEMFHECNQLYFDNQVEAPKYFEVWTPYKKVLGMVRPVFNSKSNSYVPALHISRLYNWTRENLLHVVVHEMIHLYIKDYMRPLKWYERLFPILRNQHETDFVEMMNHINDKYHLDITINFPLMKKYFKKRKK